MENEVIADGARRCIHEAGELRHNAERWVVKLGQTILLHTAAMLIIIPPPSEKQLFSNF